MSKLDQGIDHYIENAADFAKPILKHLRKLAHQACPQITETIKWGMPFFEYKGIVCTMASFKEHCTFGFWKHKLLDDPKHVLEKRPFNKAMGQLGRISALADLPSDAILISYIQQAVALNEAGIKISRKSTNRFKVLTLPDDFSHALVKHPPAKTTFDQFNYSNQKEYLVWIAEAKTEETRRKRIITSIEWLSEGKSKNWKYLSRKK